MHPEPWEVWNAIIDKRIEVGLAGLTDRERTVFLVNTFLCDFENGAYLYNLSPTDGGRQWAELRSVADAVEAVGENATATVLREMATLFEGADVSAAATWRDFIALADPDGKRVQLEAALHQRRGDLWDRLGEYTVEHFGARPS
jgi:hypothetical protein